MGVPQRADQTVGHDAALHRGGDAVELRPSEIASGGMITITLPSGRSKTPSLRA